MSEIASTMEVPTATIVSVGPPAASLEGAKRAASKLKVTGDPPTYDELLKIRDDVVLAPESLDLDPVDASADELARVAELRCAAQFCARFGAILAQPLTTRPPQDGDPRAAGRPRTGGRLGAPL